MSVKLIKLHFKQVKLSLVLGYTRDITRSDYMKVYIIKKCVYYD